MEVKKAHSNLTTAQTKETVTRSKEKGGKMRGTEEFQKGQGKGV